MIFLWMQNLISVIIVSVLSLLGLVSTEPLTWRLIKVWFPVNVIFVGMLITSMFRYEIFNFVAIIIFTFNFRYNMSIIFQRGWWRQILCDWFYNIYLCFICFFHMIMGLFGLPYLSLSTSINASETVWESLWKQLMTCS